MGLNAWRMVCSPGEEARISPSPLRSQGRSQVLCGQIPILRLATLKKQNLFFFFFFFCPKTLLRRKISQALTPREEVLHLPVIQILHLRGVDSLRVVYFLSLLFPSFSVSCPVPSPSSYANSQMGNGRWIHPGEQRCYLLIHGGRGAQQHLCFSVWANSWRLSARFPL